MKYKEFDKLITEMSGENASDDYWYDVGVNDAMTLLEKFSDNDWEQLLDNMLSKSIEWQTRFAYCADSDINDEVIIKCLVLLSSIDDDELFETCVDSLRCIVNSNNIEIIESNKTIMQRVEKTLPQCGIVKRKIFEDFIRKLKGNSNFIA